MVLSTASSVADGAAWRRGGAVKLALLAGGPPGVGERAEPLLKTEGGGLVFLELPLENVGWWW